jgi:hypothetical protein
MAIMRLNRVRIEDLTDDLKQGIGELLNAGQSAAAMSRLEAQGFLEPTSAEGDILALEKKLLGVIAKLPASHMKGLQDGPVASLVHQELRLTPAQASDHGLWVAIAILGLKYVQARWDNAALHVFAGRSDNAWERPWWVGELLSVNGDYQSCLDYSQNTNATNEINRLFVRDKAWAIAFARLVAHYNPGGKAGHIGDHEINDLSKKVRIISRSVPLPTPYSKSVVPGPIDERELNIQIKVALKLLQSQIERTPIHARCGFSWPD